MKKILALVIAIVLVFTGTIASAENYYESFRDNKWKHFRVKDDNNVISVRDSVMKFEFPEKIDEDDNYAAFIFKQGMRFSDSFCAELSMRVSNPAQAKGEILLRNYYSAMGFYTLATLENGNIVFPDGKTCAIPVQTFRLVIFRNGDFLYTLINGEQKNRCAVNEKFSFSDELELRITMSNQSVPLGSSECIEIANIYIYPDMVPEEFLSKMTDSKSYIQNFDSDGLLYFRKNDRSGAIDVRDEELSFYFSAQEMGTEAFGSYIYMQDVTINDTFCLETSVEFDDPSLADGQILLRNYYAGQGILNLCAFRKGTVVFANGASMEFPKKFRLKIRKEENNIVSIIDGEIVNITEIPSAFSLKEKQEVRITFLNSNAAETGRAHEVRLDNLMLLLDADLNELQIKEAEMFFDYGNGVYWKETELDNTVNASDKMKENAEEKM